MVPVEAMASGRPVVAFGRGGATETVAEDILREYSSKNQQSRPSRRQSEVWLISKSILKKIEAHASRFGREQFFKRCAQTHRWPFGWKGDRSLSAGALPEDFSIVLPVKH